MTEEVMESLPEKLKPHICTLKRASMDTTKNIPMCESGIEVVNFDKIPNEFARGRGWSSVPKSNDALYKDVDGKWFFVEFKNGTIKTHEIYRKLYDSLIMLLEWGIFPSFDFIRNHVNYILVYNGEKTERIQPSVNRDATYEYITQLAKQEEKLFGIEKFEKYLFNETHTYTPDLFEKNFIRPKEEEERRNS
ncbi:hypothetical protein QUW49_04685 [Lacrimispora saccharolytica]|nr:hypothetical protein [Lacrimispora saccharolytica]MDM8247935.1 hypothetical protein [Lacrimispora saccharolytica]